MRVNLLQGTCTPQTHAHAGRTQPIAPYCRPLAVRGESERSRFGRQTVTGRVGLLSNASVWYVHPHNSERGSRRMQQSSPDQDGYRALLKCLATLSPPLFVMGGFAEDALLFHRITGQHADLDVLVVHNQLNQHLQQLTALSLAESSTLLEEAPKHPLILGTHVDSPHIEIWVSTPEPSGGYSFDVDGQPPPSRYRLFLPEDTFHYPATMIEGIAIQTISPLALYHLRAISAMTRHVGEKRAKDLAMQEQLRQTFLADRDERKLTPRLMKL